MHSLDEAKEIAKAIIAAGIGVNKNDDIALSDEQLNQL
jgi:S-ribosylhomocysteine lyase